MSRTKLRLGAISGSMPANSASAYEFTALNAAGTAELSLLKFDTRSGVEVANFGIAIESPKLELATGVSVTGIADEDNMASDSAALLVTQQSVKAYVDSVATASDLDFVTDTGSGGSVDLDSEALSVLGGEGMNVTHSNQTITVAGEEATDSNKGIASFSSADFDVASGAVSIKDDAIVQAYIGDDAVGADQLAANSVVSNSIVDGTIVEGDLADNAVTLDKMAGIARGKLIMGDSSGNPSYTAAADAAGEIFVSSNANGDLAPVAISGDATLAANGALTIAAGAVEHAMLAGDAVDGDNIADDSVDSEHYVDASVDFAHMQNVAANSLLIRNANSSGVLSELALATTQIMIGDGTGMVAAALSGDVTMTNAGVVTIGAGTVENSMLADDAVGADELAANAVVFASVDSGAYETTLVGSSSKFARADAIKAYVDATKQGLSAKDSVRVASTANIAALDNGADAGAVIDGVTLVAGDRILLKDQTAGEDNGVYTVSADGNAPTRAVDMDLAAEFEAGAYFFVEEGTISANAGFVLTTTGDIVVDTTALAFTQFSGAGAITAGLGLSKAGANIALDLNELVAEQIASGDFIPMIDSDGGSHKESIDDIATLFAGVGLSASSAVMALDLNELTAVQIASGDFVSIVDSSDNSTKKESIDDVATLFAGAGMTATSAVMNVIGGDGITANANDIAVTAAQTTVTSVLNGALVLGRDGDNQIDFGTDNQIRFEVDGGVGVIMKPSGLLEGTRGEFGSLGLSGNAEVLGSLDLGHATDNTLTASGGDLSIQGNRLFRAGGTDIPVADGGTGVSALSDIVIAGGIGALTVSGGDDTVIGGDVTLSVSGYVEDLHDKMTSTAASAAWPVLRGGMMMLFKDGGGNLSLEPMLQTRSVYRVGTGSGDSAEGSELDLSQRALGTMGSSSTSAEDSIPMVKVFVNGQLMREGANTGTIGAEGSAAAAPQVGPDADYVFFRNTTGAGHNLDADEGSHIKFAFDLSAGDLVQVMFMM